MEKLEEEKGRRLRRYLVTDVLLTYFLEGDTEIHMRVTEGLPEGATFQYSFIDQALRPGTIQLVYAHETFDEVPYGAEIPIAIPVRFERINCAPNSFSE